MDKIDDAAAAKKKREETVSEVKAPQNITEAPTEIRNDHNFQKSAWPPLWSYLSLEHLVGREISVRRLTPAYHQGSAL